MKQKIKLNLENLFSENYDVFKNTSFIEFVDSITGNNPQEFNLDTNSMGNSYAEEEIVALNNLKENQELIELYVLVKKNLQTGKEIVTGFKNEILESLEIIKKKVESEKKEFKTQLVFIEHDCDPVACFCGFGEGDYPILEAPKYIDFNYEKELFNGVGQIDYSQLWNAKVEFEEILEEADDELDMRDLILNTEEYNRIQSAYKFKTFSVLYEAFDQISFQSFEGIPVTLPLFIFGNEHDCESINVYVYE